MHAGWDNQWWVIAWAGPWKLLRGLWFRPFVNLKDETVVLVWYPGTGGYAQCSLADLNRREAYAHR